MLETIRQHAADVLEQLAAEDADAVDVFLKWLRLLAGAVDERWTARISSSGSQTLEHERSNLMQGIAFAAARSHDAAAPRRRRVRVLRHPEARTRRLRGSSAA